MKGKTKQAAERDSGFWVRHTEIMLPLVGYVD
jgi:hypothetical protein